MMAKKLIATALVVLAFGFAMRANAGTDMIGDYKNPVPSYNYGYVPPPPPRPIYYAPAVNVLVFPAYGYCGPRFVGVHRFHHAYPYAHHRWP